jgi:hypothetical protein
MQEITSNESHRNDKNSESNNNRAAHIIAERFALSYDHAREVARLAGLGSDEVQR